MGTAENGVQEGPFALLLAVATGATGSRTGRKLLSFYPFQPMPGPRSVRDGTCDHAGAGQGSGAGGSSCTSERPTRAFPAALLTSRPRRGETSCRPPFTSASYWLAPEDFRLQSRGRGRPERHATAILLPKRSRLSPCYRRFSLVAEALFFEVCEHVRGQLRHKSFTT